MREDNTTEKSVNNKRRLANIAINDMLADVAYFYGLEGEIKIEWGRAVANSSRDNQELMADYNAGTLPLRDYLRKRWTDLSEFEIERMARDIEEERSKQIDTERAFEDYLNANSKQTAQSAGNSFGGSGNKNTFGGEE